MANNIKVLTTLMTMLLGWSSTLMTTTATSSIMRLTTRPAPVDVSYVLEACKVTRYYDLCVKTLASFSDKARTNPSRWARAGVSVTIGSAEEVATYLFGLKSHRGNMTGRTYLVRALADCVETLQDAIYNLHRSLNVLRKLNIGEFEFQMSNLVTWLSAALTDETTCIDGIRGISRQPVVVLQYKIVNVSYMTSNALALANWLANSGIDQSQLLGGPYNKPGQDGA